MRVYLIENVVFDEDMTHVMEISDEMATTLNKEGRQISKAEARVILILLAKELRALYSDN